jgi:hypothetical protein
MAVVMETTNIAQGLRLAGITRLMRWGLHHQRLLAVQATPPHPATSGWATTSCSSRCTSNGMRNLTNTISVTAMVLLVPLLLVHLVNAEAQTDNIKVDNQSQPDTWRLWVFIYNVPANASDIRVKLEDNSSSHNELQSTVIGPDTSVADPKGLTVMWANFVIPVNVINNGTGYSVCVAGNDIKSVCEDGFIHNGNNTSTYTGFNWFGIPRAETNNDTNTNSPYQDQYHGNRV